MLVGELIQRTGATNTTSFQTPFLSEIEVSVSLPKQKGKLYKTWVRTTMVYGGEVWAMRTEEERKLFDKRF